MKNYAARLRWITQIEEGVEVHNTLRDLHNSLYRTKAKFINCFIIHLKKLLV